MPCRISKPGCLRSQTDISTITAILFYTFVLTDESDALLEWCKWRFFPTSPCRLRYSIFERGR
jgi:hypothetical protein